MIIDLFFVQHDDEKNIRNVISIWNRMKTRSFSSFCISARKIGQSSTLFYFSSVCVVSHFNRMNRVNSEVFRCLSFLVQFKNRIFIFFTPKVSITNNNNNNTIVSKNEFERKREEEQALTERSAISFSLDIKLNEKSNLFSFVQTCSIGILWDFHYCCLFLKSYSRFYSAFIVGINTVLFRM